jgi:adenosylcobinamide-phosphate synthase
MAVKLVLAYLLDLLWGDPPAWPHPVRGLGRLIAALERPLRRIFPKAKEAGLALAGIVIFLSGAGAFALEFLAGRLHPALGFGVGVCLIYLAISVKDLADHAISVHQPLMAGDLPAARAALSRIVGRDTTELSEVDIIRATVETVAENTVDGVISPLFYAALGGATLAWIYKAANTLDSMVGYKNTRFREYGWGSARVDDLLNWVPARLSGVFLTLGAWCSGMNGAQCWRIFQRDGRHHPSPNAGFPEAAMSGALGVQLGGASSYAGCRVDKPRLGEPDKPLEPEVILGAVRLLYATSAVTVLLLGLLATGARFLLT